MKQIPTILLLSLVLTVGVWAQAAKTSGSKPAHKAAPAMAGGIVRTADLKWMDGPFKGTQFAVVSGDPSKAGQVFTVRLKAPAGTKIPPHYHPTDEFVTAMKGSFDVGMGDDFDESKMQAMNEGDVAAMPKHMHHYAMCKSACEVQVHAMGPFQILYVHAEDNPNPPAKPAAKKPAKSTK